MVVICFMVDISLLSSASLKAVKNCLLQFGNLHALRSSKRTCDSTPENGVGLCYIGISESTRKYELTVVQRPNGAFDLRRFHHAVRTMPSSPLDKVKLDGCEYSNQGENGLLTWATQDVAKKVVVISSRFLESVTACKHSLLEAADHFVNIEFIEIEQSEHPDGKIEVDDIKEPSDRVQAIYDFATQVSEFENCTLHRVPFDPWTLMRLTKRWHQDIVFGSRAGPVEAVLLFPVALSALSNKLFCSFEPAVMQLEDVFKPCKVCSCHGQPLMAPSKVNAAQAAMCCVTGQQLGTHAVADNGIVVGSGIVLSMPSFKTSVIPTTGSFGQGNPVAFDVIKCVPLETLSEGLLFGVPYIVSPSSEVDHDIEAEAVNIQVNEQTFAALLQDLHARDSGLLCTSTTNIESGEESAFLCFYVLLPAPSGSFSAKRLAGAEETMVGPESASALQNVKVPDELKSTISAGLSELGTETYNPLKHLRGCHSKLTCLVKESLQPPHLRDHCERIDPARPPNTGRSDQLRNDELLISDHGFDSEGRSIEKPQSQPGNFIILPNVTATPASIPSPQQRIMPPTGKRKFNRQQILHKSSTPGQTAGWIPKGKPKLHQGLRYPSLPKPYMTNEQDPYSFSTEASLGKKLPQMLPSKRFPNFKTARQHLLDNGAKTLG